MEPVLKIEVPGHPVGKGRPRAGRRWRKGKTSQYTAIWTPQATVAYEQFIGIQGNLAMHGRPPIAAEVPVKIEILIMFEVPKSWSMTKRQAAIQGDIRPIVAPDWDNISKCVGDGLNKIVWADDSQIVDARVQKFYGARSFVHIEVFL